MIAYFVLVGTTRASVPIVNGKEYVALGADCLLTSHAGAGEACLAKVLAALTDMQRTPQRSTCALASQARIQRTQFSRDILCPRPIPLLLPPTLTTT